MLWIKSLDFQDYRDEIGDFHSMHAAFCPLVAGDEVEQSVATINGPLYSVSHVSPEFRKIRENIRSIADKYLDEKSKQ